MRQGLGLARARPRDDQQRPIAMRASCGLRLVEGSIATSWGHSPNTRQMFSPRKIAMLSSRARGDYRVGPAKTSLDYAALQ
jgi:hypothetical protein